VRERWFGASGRRVPEIAVEGELELALGLDALAPLDDVLEDADLVVTGEGFLDEQSFDGKVVGGVLEWAADAGTPQVAVIAGQVTDDAREEMAVHGGAQLLALTDRVWQSAETFSRAGVLVEEAALEAGRRVAEADR